MNTRFKESSIWYLSPLLIGALAFTALVERTAVPTPDLHEAFRVIQSDSEAGVHEQTLFNVQTSKSLDPNNHPFMIRLNDQDQMVGIKAGSYYLPVEKLERGFILNASSGIAAQFNPLGKLTLTDFHPSRGGNLSIQFLADIRNHAMKTFDFSIQHVGNRWIAISSPDQGQREFSLATFVPKVLHIPMMNDKPYGIDRVELQ